MSTILFALWLSLAAGIALAQDAAIGNETPATDQATDQASDKAEVKSSAAAKAEKERFRPPLGFTTKKRGSLVLYCKKDSTVGTRFLTEKCYSEDQVRDYLIAQQENKRDIDRIRNTCSTGEGEFCRRP